MGERRNWTMVIDEGGYLVPWEEGHSGEEVVVSEVLPGEFRAAAKHKLGCLSALEEAAWAVIIANPVIPGSTLDRLRQELEKEE